VTSLAALLPISRCGIQFLCGYFVNRPVRRQDSAERGARLRRGLERRLLQR